MVDFDGDGRLDLISGSNCCDPNGLIAFLRKQDGSWEPRREIKVMLPGGALPNFLMARSFVTAADWNGDGVPDLLWMRPKEIRVALGPITCEGPISLTHRLNIGYSLAHELSGIADFAVADWDHDGKLDVLVRARDVGERWEGWEITCYRNVGGPGLTRLAAGKSLLRVQSTGYADGFCVCDWNADGRPDLMVTRCERLPRTAEREDDEHRESVLVYLRK